MMHRAFRRALGAATAGLAVLAPATLLATSAEAGPTYGPSRPFVEVLHGQFKFTPLPDAAMIVRAKHGYTYKAGQQNSNLKVTSVAGKLRFHDKGTKKLRSLPRSCHRVRADRGIAATCRVGAKVSGRNPMLLQIWPRLGHDAVDTTALPAKFQVTVLGDAGSDVIRLGAGDDFVNGAAGRDRVWGGGGSEWIRTGKGHDYLNGGPGRDRLVGVEGNDRIIGGPGRDVLGGGPGKNSLTQ
jgi:Ca2+-binding RTX toxin-like protein